MNQFSELITLKFGEFRPNTSYLSLDTNNDGLTDIVEIWQGVDSSANATTWFSDGDGRFGNEVVTTNFLGGFSANRTYLSLDANNDGRTDIVEIWQDIDGTANTTAWFNIDANGRFGNEVVTLDFGDFSTDNTYLSLDANNDGRTDIVEIWQGLDGTANVTTRFSNGNGSFKNVSYTWDFGDFSTNSTYLSLDGNNDGRTDIVEIWQDVDGTANVTTWFNNGNGIFNNQIVTLDFGDFSTDNTYLSLDGNNDGLTDIVEIWQGLDGTANITTWFNDGNGRFGIFGDISYTWDFGEFRPDSSYLVLETNSDDRTDLVQVWQDTDSSANVTTWINSQNFEQFLEALGELRLGKVSGDPEQYRMQNEQTNATGKYQFTEIEMQELGYYNDNNVFDNLWSGTWTNKNGITDLDSLMQKSAVQETAIRESLLQNYDDINSRLDVNAYLVDPNNQEVKTVRYYQLNEDRTDFLRDEDNNLIVITEEVNLSLAGILAATYLKDGLSVSEVLTQLNNQNSVDFTALADFGLEYYQQYLFDKTNTSIFQYFHDFGEYDVATEDFSFSNYGDATNYVLYGTFNDNSIDGGEGDDSITGGFGRDILRGGNGNDSISGEQGDDTLVGSLGNDLLTGGSGTDKFRFNSFNEGNDTITDFNATDGDKIEVPEFSFGQVLSSDDPETRAIQESIFELGSSATNADTRFIYNSSTQQLFYDRDGNDSNFDPVALATFEGAIDLTANDIVLW